MKKNKINVCIVGFGKMGHIYSKYLDGFGVKWSYYDPFVTGGLKKLVRINNYSHIIISTPPENHYEAYKMIMDMGFEGYIYIDKPVIISDDHSDVLDNKNVFCGMTERYNPVVVALKELLNLESLISIKFSRYSTAPDNMKTPIIFDLGIHDLDLYLYLLDFDKFPEIYDLFEKSNTCYVLAQQNDVLSIFEWSHESHRRERKIVVLEKDTVYETDLIDQTIVSYEIGGVIRNLYVAKSQPLKRVMQSFLKGDQCGANLSHEFMFEIMRGGINV